MDRLVRPTKRPADDRLAAYYSRAAEELQLDAASGSATKPAAEGVDRASALPGDPKLGLLLLLVYSFRCTTRQQRKASGGALWSTYHKRHLEAPRFEILPLLDQFEAKAGVGCGFVPDKVRPPELRRAAPFKWWPCTRKGGCGCTAVRLFRRHPELAELDRNE